MVANTANRADELPALPTVTEFVAEPLDVNGDIVRADGVPPDRPDDVIVSRDPSPQTDEIAEQVQLSSSQVNLPAVDPHLAAVRVNGCARARAVPISKRREI